MKIKNIFTYCFISSLFLFSLICIWKILVTLQGIELTNFNFNKFPFDEQKLSIEIWSEYPSNLVRFKPNEPAMTSYKESGVSPTTGEKLYVDGWSLGSIDYETWSYVDKTDNKPYTGFYLYIDIILVYKKIDK